MDPENDWDEQTDSDLCDLFSNLLDAEERYREFLLSLSLVGINVQWIEDNKIKFIETLYPELTSDVQYKLIQEYGF